MAVLALARVLRSRRALRPGRTLPESSTRPGMAGSGSDVEEGSAVFVAHRVVVVGHHGGRTVGFFSSFSW